MSSTDNAQARREDGRARMAAILERVRIDRKALERAMNAMKSPSNECGGQEVTVASGGGEGAAPERKAIYGRREGVPGSDEPSRRARAAQVPGTEANV